ncbi:MAG: hypothetical protein U1E45_05760 [Geminicoccaceae bacterium]
MGVLSIMLHRNPDGDRWLLVPWPDQEAYRVVHIESERAGGHIAIFEVDAFLRQDGNAPPVRALRDLFDTPVAVMENGGRPLLAEAALA